MLAFERYLSICCKITKFCIHKQHSIHRFVVGFVCVCVRVCYVQSHVQFLHHPRNQLKFIKLLGVYKKDILWSISISPLFQMKPTFNAMMPTIPSSDC